MTTKYNHYNGSLKMFRKRPIKRRKKRLGLNSLAVRKALESIMHLILSFQFLLKQEEMDTKISNLENRVQELDDKRSNEEAQKVRKSI